MSRRRNAGLFLLALGVLLVAGGAWVAVTGVLARSQLQAVRNDIALLRTELSGGDAGEAARTAADIEHHASRAHELTTGPAWAVLAAVPAGGEPFATTRAITAQADVLGQQVLPALVTAATRLDPATLRAPDGGIRVGRIAALAPVLTGSYRAVEHSTTVIDAQSRHTWLPSVDAARNSFATQLAQLGATLHSADLAASIAPAMLGEHRTMRYFVAFQNEAEARGTGGIPGAFAIVSASHGTIRFDRFESDGFLQTQPTGLRFGRAYDRLLVGARSTSFYVNSDITPQFSYAARIWIAMWQKRTGQHLDGALAVDPTAVSYLLATAGPASLPGGGEVTAANVVALTQQGVYAKFPALNQQPARKQYLLQIAQAVSRQILNHTRDTTGLLRAAGRAAGERRLLLYSTNTRTERQIAQTALSGDVPITTRPYVGLAVVNVAGNKLDYYLHRRLTWQRTGCGPERRVTVTARLTNAAPAHGLSPYVTERNDYPGHPTRAGDNRLAVYYYATDGAQLESLTIDGTSAPPSSGTLRGHPVFVADVELPRGRTRTVVFRLSEPASAGSPIVLHQPAVNPLVATLRRERCS